MPKPWELITLPGISSPKYDAHALDVDLDEFASHIQPHISPKLFVHTRIIRNDDPNPMKRGGHLHLDKVELLVCSSGEIKFDLHSRESCTEIIQQKFSAESRTALIIQPRTWHRIILMPNSLLVAYSNKKDTRERDITNQPCHCPH